MYRITGKMLFRTRFAVVPLVAAAAGAAAALHSRFSAVPVAVAVITIIIAYHARSALSDRRQEPSIGDKELRFFDFTLPRGMSYDDLVVRLNGSGPFANRDPRAWSYDWRRHAVVITLRGMPSRRQFDTTLARQAILAEINTSSQGRYKSFMAQPRESRVAAA